MEAKRKTLTQLSVPICLETLFYMLSGMVDTLMLSSVSDQAVGAVGTANTYIGVFIIMFGVISSGMIAVMSQNIGAGRPGIAYQARQLGLIFNALIGIVMSVILATFSGGILRIVSIAPALLEPAEIYLRIVGGTCFLNALIPIFSSYLRVFGYTKHTWYMFYDKSVFSEEDVKNLDTMLQKGTVSFPFTNSWYLPAFYLGNGCTLFGDGTDESKGVDFAGEKAVDATNYAIDLAANPNFIIDADGSALAGLRDGSVKAMFTGSWDANAIKEALGDNMGVTSLPTYTINGEEKQMLAYAGSKAIGVNAHSEYMEQAVALAVYLGGSDAQRAHYKMRTVIPCNTELLKEKDIASDPLVQAQNDTFNNTSILQPFVASMTNCWTPVENMGKGIRNKSVTHENAEEQTEAMNEAMNSNGIN